MKMERSVHRNLHVLRKFTHSQSLKIVTKLFLSVTLFSFFFSRSSLLPFLRSLNFCFSTFPYQLFTHTLDKNFMFLICNGLLVFLAKYSGLARSLSLSRHQDESRSKNFVEGSQSEFSMEPKKLISVPESNGLEENAAMEEGNEVEYHFTNQRETAKEIVEDEEQEKDSGSMATNEEQEQIDQEQKQEQQREQEEISFEHVVEHEDEKSWLKNDFLIEQQGEEEDNEEVGNGMLSTEELNKKFDEFIRRMKEELRIEAQRQLIMV